MFRAQHLQWVFKRVFHYNMCLNPDKCSFWVRVGNFLGFYLTEQRIEANPNKCEAVIQMNSPTSKKEVQRLNDMLIAFNKFILKSAYDILPYCQLLKKNTYLKWTSDC